MLQSRFRKFINKRYVLYAIPLVFLFLFFLYPLGSILVLSLRPGAEWDFSGFTRIITSTYYRDTLFFTIWQAALSTFLTIGLALPGAYIFTRFRFPGKSILMSLITLPFVLPTVAVAAAFSALLGSNGLFNEFLMGLFNLAEPPVQIERTLGLILIVHVFYNYAIALRIIASYWANQSPRIDDAARILGAHGWRLWYEIRLPMLRPAITAAAVLVFIFTFTSFGVVLILGGIRFATLEVQIYYQALNVFDLPLAAALSLVQISAMFAMMIVYTRLQRRIAGDFQTSQQVSRLPATKWEWGLLLTNLGTILLLLFTPLAALVWRSLTTGGRAPSLFYFEALSSNPRNSVLFVAPIEALGNSLFFAVITTLLALFIGLLTAYLVAARKQTQFSKWMDPIFMLPLATSAVTLGFGYIITLDRPPLDLRSSWVIVPIAHSLIAIPFVIRSVLPTLRAIPPSVQEAAAVLGANPFQVWRYVDLPLISRGLIVGASFAFTVSMGEFGASLFLARPDTPTLPIVIFRLLGQPGATNYGQALALSVILMFVCATAFILIERLRSNRVGEF